MEQTLSPMQLQNGLEDTETVSLVLLLTAETSIGAMENSRDSLNLRNHTTDLNFGRHSEKARLRATSRLQSKRA